MLQDWYCWRIVGFSSVKILHKEETESLLHAFLKKEADESCSAVDMRNVSKMVTDILEGFNGLSDEKLAAIGTWAGIGHGQPARRIMPQRS